MGGKLAVFRQQLTALLFQAFYCFTVTSSSKHDDNHGHYGRPAFYVPPANPHNTDVFHQAFRSRAAGNRRWFEQ